VRRIALSGTPGSAAYGTKPPALSDVEVGVVWPCLSENTTINTSLILNIINSKKGNTETVQCKQQQEKSENRTVPKGFCPGVEHQKVGHLS
jgi:hypothetical protein